MKDVVIPKAVVISNPEEIKKGDLVNHFGVLEFECLPGYTLQGSSVTTCLDSEWSQQFPTCIPGKSNVGGKNTSWNWARVH